ncbi:hypothetical protein [Brucella anthropi]|uniref:hypothetical protein n=1 Tax=Brucella anthropi TaxID=529 RepID=UPI001CFEE5D9|nr:hypothetical protein [Brucella anthropi]
MSEIKIRLIADENPFQTFQASQLGEECKEAYELIGRILALWNRIESDIVYLSSWIHPILKDDLPPKFKNEPKGLDGRLRFLRYLFQEYHELSIFRDEFEIHKQNIDAVKTDRHHIVHWSILSIDKADDGFSLKMMNPEKLPRKFETKIVSRSQLLELAHKLGRIGLSLGFFTSSFDTRLNRQFGK